jgi:hypothetical protein
MHPKRRIERAFEGFDPGGPVVGEPDRRAELAEVPLADRSHPHMPLQ